MVAVGFGLTYYSICIEHPAASWEQMEVPEPTGLEGSDGGAPSLSPEAGEVALGWR